MNAIIANEQALPDSFYEDGLEVNPYAIPRIPLDLTREERKDRRYLEYMYRGVMFVEAPPGQGKDLFIMTLAYLNKRYFGRPVVLDVKPLKLFGFYHYFNPQIMMREINKMAKKAGVEGIDTQTPLSKKQEKAIDEAAQEWLAGSEEAVIFQGAVVYFHELARLCPRRNPNNLVNKFIGALVPQWRHLDTLFIGSHSLKEEIDQTTFLGHTDIWAIPKWNWGEGRRDTTSVKVKIGSYKTDIGYFNAARPAFVYHVPGGEPKEFLTKKDTIFRATPQGLREAENEPIINCLFQMGYGTTETIAKKLQRDVEEVLETLWLLSLRGYVIGNRYFDLYKSRNWVNLKPTLAKEI